MVTTPQRVIAYVRISDDREGTGGGVGRQTEDCRNLAEQLGWTITEVVDENDTSAFKRRRVQRPDGTTELRVIRPGFRQVLDLLTSGHADGLIAYDLDRTARDPRDLEDLIDAVEQRVPRIPVRSVTGSLRLDNDADITMARVMVAVANKASRDAQRRITRKHEALAKEGKPGGGGARRYGYERDGLTVVPAEAEIIVEMAQRVIDGETVNSILVDLNRRGVKPVKADRWNGATVTGILKSGRIAGLREYKGEIVGTAVWPAIIDTATRDEVLAQLTRRRLRGRQVHRFWCNHLLICGHCDGGLTGQHVMGGGHRYWCSTIPQPPGCGKLSISGKIEQHIEDFTLAFLTRPDVVDALAAGTRRVAIDETRKLLTEDEEALRALARAHGERKISLTEWLEARAPFEARVTTYRQALQAVMPRPVRQVFEAPDPATAWEGLAAGDKRDVVRAILHSQGMKGWRVAPADLAKARRLDPSRIELVALD